MARTIMSESAYVSNATMEVATGGGFSPLDAAWLSLRRAGHDVTVLDGLLSVAGRLGVATHTQPPEARGRTWTAADYAVRATMVARLGIGLARRVRRDRVTSSRGRSVQAFHPVHALGGRGFSSLDGQH